MRRLLIVLLGISVGACAGPPPERPDLVAARAAAHWIRSAERATEHGSCWDTDPAQPGSHANDLYAGGAGIVLFFLELHEASRDPQALAAAMAGADHLLASIPTPTDSVDAGLYTGVAGVGYALLEAGRLTGDPRYRAGAGRCVTLLGKLAQGVGDGVEWNRLTDIVSGNAGIGLFLLRAAVELDLAEAHELASGAGQRLLETSTATAAGLQWRLDPSDPRVYPNFSHGTAGVAFFLAKLHRHTGEQPMLDAAVAGANHLCATADGSEGGCLIHHHEPGGEDLYYRGWCHGPVGSARLFLLLHQLTGEPRWQEWLGRAARSVRAAGVPAADVSGYWNNVGQCCGSAGVAQFLLDLHRLDGDPADLDLCRRVTADLLGRATTTADGLAWVQAEHRVRPELLVAQTGYMQGAAGIGMLLLRLDAFAQGRQPSIVLPDDPWPEALRVER